MKRCWVCITHWQNSHRTDDRKWRHDWMWRSKSRWDLQLEPQTIHTNWRLTLQNNLTRTTVSVQSIKVKGKGLYSSSWGSPPQSYGTSLPYGSHSVTCHPTQGNAPRLTPAMQAGTRFIYPGGMEGWVDLVDLIFPLLCSSTPLFPTPPLVSPKFPHVHLGVGGWPLGYEERRLWTNCPCN